VDVPRIHVDPQYNPFKQATGKQHATVQHWEQLYEGLVQKQPEQSSLFDETSVEVGNEVVTDKSPTHYQYKGCYIMTAVKSGLMIIDQHRAHVRILYNSYMQMFGNHSATSQKVLFPEVVQFPPSEGVVLDKVISQIEDLGFDLTNLGTGSYAINGVPAGLDGMNMVNLLQSMVTAAVEQGKGIGEELHHALALCLARHAAIPKGQVLNNDEMENIVNQLFACSDANYSPDGKPVINIVKQEDIEKMF
jgi:DNA mismatch repair protein MutL